MSQNGDKRIKAVGMLSGGLDSTLAAYLVSAQGVEVLGVTFSTGLCKTDHKRLVPRNVDDPKKLRNEALRAGADLSIPVDIVDISREYLPVILNPKHGYGSQVNPCLDCRGFMLAKAREYMLEHGAHFVFTGEVLGQRPMSQHRQSLDIVAKESGLGRLLVRPLSARLLPETVPEEKGWLDRARLGAISGRSRKMQMEMARRFGLDDYPQPAGGCCYLTDESYARKFLDRVAHGSTDSMGHQDLVLLKVGRHFRLRDDLKVIVSRDEPENLFLERFLDGRWWFQAQDCGSPITVVEGEPDEEAKRFIAAITLRYSSNRGLSRAAVECRRGDHLEVLEVAPVGDESIEPLRI
ncbi:MAG: thiamine biosynthesis protein [Acidobacteriota bacterium]